MIGAFELGLIYGVMALGVYLTFRVLQFPDLTVDGSFTTGAAVAAAMITAGQTPDRWRPSQRPVRASSQERDGRAAHEGPHRRSAGRNPHDYRPWSVNLRIMGGPNVTLLREETVMTPLREAGLLGSSWLVPVIFFVAVMTEADRRLVPRRPTSASRSRPRATTSR